MDDKKDYGKKEDLPLEIPDNSPAGGEKPIQARKTGTGKIKIAYAFALILAVGAAFAAKIATENSLGNIGPIESDYVTENQNITQYSEIFITEPEIDFEVRNNLTDVPDTREYTEPTAPKTTQAPQTEGETKSSKYAQPYKDYFTLPVGTKILREYSPDTLQYNSTMGDWRTHNGIDFQGADGDQVKSVAYGKVKNIYEDILLGTVIEIDHGNEVVAKYCGINKDTVQVKKGATVEAGTLIGFLGTVPCEKSDISHLHFEVTYKGQNVDPLELMGR